MKLPHAGRAGSSTRSSSLRLNLTPLIDVIFNLIIFFLAASHFARSEPTETIELPVAKQSSRTAEPPHRLMITVAPRRCGRAAPIFSCGAGTATGSGDCRADCREAGSGQ